MRSPLVLLGVSSIVLGAIAQRQTPDMSVTLSNADISESSGLAPSRSHKGIYYTHNDSGDGPKIFAFDLQGRDRGTFSLDGAKAFDWEDMASARVNGKPYLYIGDVGDNLKQRKIVRIYKIPEPRILGGSRKISNYEQYICSYPDGAHDCEALIVSPQGDVQLITKDEYGKSGIYLLKRPKSAGEYKLTKLGELRLEEGNVYSHLVTGADMAADGQVIVRTYLTAILFEKGEPLSWFKRKRQSVPIAFERQGEAICFDPWDKRLITTSERSPCRVSFARLP